MEAGDRVAVDLPADGCELAVSNVQGPRLGIVRMTLRQWYRGHFLGASRLARRGVSPAGAAEALAVGVKVQQPLAEVRDPTEQRSVLRDRQARRGLFQLVPEALDVQGLREHTVRVREQPLGRHISAVYLGDAFEESAGDVGLGRFGVAVEGDNILRSATAEAVEVGDRSTRQSCGTSTKHFGEQTCDVGLSFTMSAMQRGRVAHSVAVAGTMGCDRRPPPRGRTLAQHLGLQELADSYLDLVTRRGGRTPATSCSHRLGARRCCIDDAAALRAGGTASVTSVVKAPTLGPGASAATSAAMSAGRPERDQFTDCAL